MCSLEHNYPRPTAGKQNRGCYVPNGPSHFISYVTTFLHHLSQLSMVGFHSEPSRPPDDGQHTRLEICQRSRLLQRGVQGVGSLNLGKLDTR